MVQTPGVQDHMFEASTSMDGSVSSIEVAKVLTSVEVNRIGKDKQLLRDQPDWYRI